MVDFVVAEHVSLTEHTTLKVGGTARYFITAMTEVGVEQAVQFAKERQLPLFVLGAGSNVLAVDGEYAGVVLNIGIVGKEAVVEEETNTVLYSVGAGEDLDTIIADTVASGWWGMENLSAIPSSIGAVPVQNVGAYGVEAGQLITSVRVYNGETKKIETWTASQCQFAYRDSIFKHEAGRQAIVLAVTFRLSLTAAPRLIYKDLAEYFGDSIPTQEAIRAAIITIRGKKFPDWRVVGTAGSFFKNPIIPAAHVALLKAQYPELPVYDTEKVDMKKISLGFILDKVCHLKGYCEGPVCLYQEQALVLTVVPGSDANVVIEFAKKITEKVFAATNISIEWEVVLLSK